MNQDGLPQFLLLDGVLTVSGRITSANVPLLKDYLADFTLTPHTALMLDFSFCTVFSTGAIPALLEFISKAKFKKMNLSIKMGQALRKACTIASVIPAIKRLDPDV